MSKLYLVRQAAERGAGAPDRKLTVREFADARESIGGLLASREIRVVYTAPTVRARDTAFAIINKLPAPVHFAVAHSLAPRNWGELHGESCRDVGRRALELVTEATDRPEGGNILVVTHNSVLRPLVPAVLTGQVSDIEQDPDSGIELYFGEGSVTTINMQSGALHYRWSALEGVGFK